jgi:hypothetical protein
MKQQTLAMAADQGAGFERPTPDRSSSFSYHSRLSRQSKR